VRPPGVAPGSVGVLVPVLTGPTLGREFDSGFQIDAKDLKQVSPSFPIRLRCKVCMEFHEFKFASGRIA
jgi:hypothetical protein